MSFKSDNPYAVVPLYLRGKKNYLIQKKEDMSFLYLPSKYLKHLSMVKESPNTVKKVAFSITYYLRYLAEKSLKLKDVFAMSYGSQTEHFREFLLWIKYGMHMDNKAAVVKNNTCNSYLGDVFGWLQYLHMEFGEEFPEIKVLIPKGAYYCRSLGAMVSSGTRTTFEGYLPKEDSCGETLNKDEVIQLLNACTNVRDKLQIALMAETGMRAGELLGIHYDEDIDLENKTIQIRFRERNKNEARAKNRENRTVLMSDSVYKLLVEYMTTYSDVLKNHKYLFVNIQGNNEGDVEFMNTLQATFRRLEEKTGIYARPHMLRHYFAQSRLDAGWKLPMIANALGHKDIRTTELYLKIPEKERLVASKEYFEMYGSLIDEEETSL